MKAFSDVVVLSEDNPVLAAAMDKVIMVAALVDPKGSQEKGNE